MHWNYRVVEMTEENGGEYLIAIREVYYEENGMPSGHCEPSMISESAHGLEEIVDRMKEALSSPPLTSKDFKGE